MDYINERIALDKEVKHKLNNHDVPCISYQESKILINSISSIDTESNKFTIKYENLSNWKKYYC